MTPEPFGARLRRAMDERGPLCVGIDPHASLLADWGLNDDVAGLARFTRTVVESLGETVALFKPQSAFFERFGSRGLAVLETAVEEARERGALVLMDAKRGDIGSTMAAYAETYLRKDSPLFSDALTVSPYLGYGSLKAGRRPGTRERRRALRPRPHLQPGGCRGPAGGARGRAYARRDHARPPRGRERRCRAAGLLRRGRRRHARRSLLVRPGDQRPAARTRHRRPGRHPADLPKVFGDAVRNVVPSVSRGCCGTARTPRLCAPRRPDSPTKCAPRSIESLPTGTLVPNCPGQQSLTRTFRLFSLTLAPSGASLRREHCT